MRNFTLYYFTVGDDEDGPAETLYFSSLAEAVENAQSYCDRNFISYADSLNNMINWEVTVYKCEFLCDKDIEGLICGILNGDDEANEFLGKREIVKELLPSDKAIEELKESL